MSQSSAARVWQVFAIDVNSFCTVLEYCDGNDLDMHLKEHPVSLRSNLLDLIGDSFRR